MKVKAFIKRNMRKLSALCMAAMVTSVMAVSAFAAEGGTSASSTSATIISAFTAGFQSIVNDALSIIGSAVPIIIPMAGTIFLARKAMSWFKSMAK